MSKSPLGAPHFARIGLGDSTLHSTIFLMVPCAPHWQLQCELTRCRALCCNTTMQSAHPGQQACMLCMITIIQPIGWCCTLLHTKPHKVHSPHPRLFCTPRAPCSRGATAFCCNPPERRCYFSNEPDRRKLRNHSNKASDATIAVQCIQDHPHTALHACVLAGAPDHIPTSPCRHPECTRRVEPHPS
jgi:hypothetical protein